MKRALYFTLITILAGGSLFTRPAWSQDPPDGANGRGRDRRTLDTKTRGDNAAGKLGKSPEELLFEEFSKAMQWELKTNEATTEQIRQIIKQYRPKKDAGIVEQTDDEGEENRELKEAALKAVEDGDQERFQEIKEQLSDNRRNVNEQSDVLDPEMFYEIDAVLKEPLRNDFWQIVARFTHKEKIYPGGRYLDLLKGLQVSEEQGAAISRLYVKYMNAMREAYRGDGEVGEAVQESFQDELLAQLTKEQKAAFQKAVKNDDRGDKRNKREAHSNW